MKYLLLNPSADFHFNSPHPPKYEYWYFKINKTIMVRIFVKLTSSLVISSKNLYNNRSSRPEVFLGKGVLKICSRFTGEHPCRSVISIKLQSNFIKITLWHGCPPVNLLHIFRTPCLKNTSGRLLLQ